MIKKTITLKRLNSKLFKRNPKQTLAIHKLLYKLEYEFHRSLLLAYHTLSISSFPKY